MLVNCALATFSTPIVALPLFLPPANTFIFRNHTVLQVFATIHNSALLGYATSPAGRLDVTCQVGGGRCTCIHMPPHQSSAASPFTVLPFPRNPIIPPFHKPFAYIPPLCKGNRQMKCKAAFKDGQLRHCIGFNHLRRKTFACAISPHSFVRNSHRQFWQVLRDCRLAGEYRRNGHCTYSK